MTPGRQVILGGVDLSFAVAQITVTNQRSMRPEAQVILDLDRSPSSVIDLAAEMTIIDTDHDRPLFTGEVSSARRSGRRLHVAASTGLELTDTAIADTINIGIDPLELMRTLLVQAGFSEERFNIDGLEEPKPDYFEVVVPVVGLATSTRLRLGDAALLPRSVVLSHPWLHRPGVQPHMREAFGSFDAYLAVGTTGTWVTDAEEQGLRKAREILALIAIDTRCGLASGPDGGRLRYARSDTRIVPAPAGWCLVRGVNSGRGWVRNTSARSLLDPIQTTILPTFGALFDRRLPEDLTLAALSLYDAITGTTPIVCNASFWNAVEFYAGSVSAPKLFTKKDHARLTRQVIRSGAWSQDQQARMLIAKELLNQAPLLWRFRKRLVDDAVPFIGREFDGVTQLRALRNDNVHGRHSDGPEAKLLRDAISLLSRAIVFSAAR